MLDLFLEWEKNAPEVEEIALDSLNLVGNDGEQELKESENKDEVMDKMTDVAMESRDMLRSLKRKRDRKRDERRKRDRSSRRRDGRDGRRREDSAPRRSSSRPDDEFARGARDPYADGRRLGRNLRRPSASDIHSNEHSRQRN
eukprot:CAMPEP_0116896028 /NCGR_PEP_ID=MMETSP0467-20121206/5376_1 /TAXON_ID=283647 /ORGANISM="Mesodinium pulex, Strain SPMC105" /LENGTH=142 /DNA_ID=CAMNT_0004566997 /DNA_START=900 /DNA_END=1328 /DNA_ORIENTATION=+